MITLFKLRKLSLLINTSSIILLIISLFLLNVDQSLKAQTNQQTKPAAKNYLELVNRINLLEFEIERIKNGLPAQYLENLNNERIKTSNKMQNSNKEINKLFISKIELIEKNLQSLTAQIEKLEHTQVNQSRDINFLTNSAKLLNSAKNQKLLAGDTGDTKDPIINTEVENPVFTATTEESVKINKQVDDGSLNLINDENQEKKKQYTDSVEKIKGGEYVGGAKDLISFLDRYPNDSLEPNAYYWLAESHYARQDFVNAAKYFWQGYKSDKTSNKAPDNLLKLGLSLQALNNLAASCDALNKYKKEFPNQPEQQIQIADKVITSNNCK